MQQKKNGDDLLGSTEPTRTFMKIVLRYKSISIVPCKNGWLGSEDGSPRHPLLKKKKNVENICTKLINVIIVRKTSHFFYL